MKAKKSFCDVCCIYLLPKLNLEVFCCHKTEVYWEPSQTSKMNVLAKVINGLKLLNISAKSSILDVSLVSESVFVKVEAKHQFNFFSITKRFN